MRNHFIFAYAGNKRNEVKDILPHINLDGIDTFIEPFCGTSAVSFALSQQQPLKYKYILNDIDTELISLYVAMKDPSELAFIENEVDRLLKDLNEEKYYEILAKNTIFSYIIARIHYMFRIGIYGRTRAIKKACKFHKQPIVNFMRTEDINLSSVDALDIMENHLRNPKCVIYLDPPYMKTASKDYYKKHDEMYVIYDYLAILNKDDIKCKIYLNILYNEDIHEKIKNSFTMVHSYDKVYEWGKRKVKRHVLYSNIL